MAEMRLKLSYPKEKHEEKINGNSFLGLFCAGVWSNTDYSVSDFHPLARKIKTITNINKKQKTCSLLVVRKGFASVVINIFGSGKRLSAKVKGKEKLFLCFHLLRTTFEEGKKLEITKAN